jgi:hypothetical protein
MNAASKTVVIDIVMSALRELSDVEYQRRVWLGGSNTEISSMNEATAALYNDSGLDEALEKNQVTFSAEIDAELRQLRTSLQSNLAGQVMRGTGLVIASPEWKVVASAASRILTQMSSIGEQSQQGSGPTT